jgi:hypothetical protein
MAEDRIRIDLDVDVNPLSQMKNELRQIKGEMIGVTDAEEFARMASRAAELETELKRVNSAVSQISKSGDDLPRMSASLKGVTSSLANLDFTAAAESAAQLQRISSQMTFATAIKGVKNLGSTFISLGKALLANPIFLIVAAIVAIGVAIYKLLDELGILKIMFEAIGEAIDWLLKPIKWLIQGLKDLTDWFGWTSHAEEEAAEKARIAAEKRAEAQQRLNRAVENNYSREIALMKAQGAEIEDIEDKEIELAKIKIKNFAQEQRMTRAQILALKAIGKVSKEQLDQLHEMEQTYKNLLNDLDVLEATVDNNRKKRAEKAIEDEQSKADKYRDIQKRRIDDTKKFLLDLARAEEDYNLKSIEDEVEREKQIALIKLERRNEDIDFSKMTAEAKVAWEKWYQDEIERINLEATKKYEDIEKVKRDKEIDEEKKHQEALLKVVNDLFAEQQQLTPTQKVEAEYAERMTALKAALESEAITMEQFREKQIKAEQDKADALIAIDEAVRQSQIDGIDMATQKVLAAIASGAAEGSGIAKAAGIAQATIDTYKAAQASYSSLAGIPVIGPALGAAAASAAVAMGVQNIRKIASTPTPGGGSGGGVPSMPSVSGMRAPEQTPNFEFFGQPNNETQNQTTQTQGSSQPVKAYVLQSEIAEVDGSNEMLKNMSQL